MAGVGSWFGRELFAIVVLLMVLVGVSAGAVPVQRSATAAAPPPRPAVLRIMPLGASSTVGKGSPETAGYRGPLQALLARDGVTVDMVGSRREGPASVPDRDFEGVSGLTLEGMQPLVAEWVGQARPDVVLLHMGTNDILRRTAPAKAAALLEVILTEIVEVSDAHVIVAGVWGHRGDVGAREEFERLSAAVIAGFRQRGHSMRFIDATGLLAADQLADQLHPNAAGYRLIAARWEREILAITGRRPGAF
jgi:lysophospholipase L1-like esterase